MDMERDHVVRFLRTVPLFYQSTDEQLVALADEMQCRAYEEGEQICGDGPEQNELLIAVQGEYSVLLHQTQIDVEAELARLYPGDYFGDLALVSGLPPQVKIRVVSAGLMLCLSKEHFEKLFEAQPDFARRICKSLARYVLQTYDRLGSVPYVQLDRFSNLASTIPLLPTRICRACRCLVVEKSGLEIKVAMVDPTNHDTRRFVSSALRSYDLQWVAISEGDFESFAARYLGDEHERRDDVQLIERLVCTNPAGEFVPLGGPGETTHLAQILSQAIRYCASDIHLEPGVPAGGVRLRVDGRMTGAQTSITLQELRQLVSQIKVLAELDITRSLVPQDGSFTLQADESRFEVRVSTIPCLGGEKAVLRLISPNPQFERLDNLIVEPALARLVADIFDSPSGLVLVTGPTGSGKTTTLYAGLNSIWRSDQEINIVTIEDPIEYNLPFATQVQVNREVGLTFAAFMRSVLRQDPDVILVGEIRDAESAAIALEAATTGHLVLSSLHTHSAFETIARLRQLQVKPYLLADALRGVISQQLLPRMRPGVAAPVERSDNVYERLATLGILPTGYDGVVYRPTVSRNGSPTETRDDVESGRVAVFEVLAMTDTLRDLIEREAPLSDLRASVEPRLFRPLVESARGLLERRLVTPERVERLFSRVDAKLATSTPRVEFASR
jgi:type II secretory ATPase GspE/PulE/Tfp pilus assembly ATPase PilB-like protein